jgi:hypothetical protein
MTTLRVSRDMRDLAQMLAHVHDAEIEISEGQEPSPMGPVGAVTPSGSRRGREGLSLHPHKG